MGGYNLAAAPGRGSYFGDGDMFNPEVEVARIAGHGNAWGVGGEFDCCLAGRQSERKRYRGRGCADGKLPGESTRVQRQQRWSGNAAEGLERDEDADVVRAEVIENHGSATGAPTPLGVRIRARAMFLDGEAGAVPDRNEEFCLFCPAGPLVRDVGEVEEEEAVVRTFERCGLESGAKLGFERGAVVGVAEAVDVEAAVTRGDGLGEQFGQRERTEGGKPRVAGPEAHGGEAPAERRGEQVRAQRIVGVDFAQGHFRVGDEGKLEDHRAGRELALDGGEELAHVMGIGGGADGEFGNAGRRLVVDGGNQEQEGGGAEPGAAVGMGAAEDSVEAEGDSDEREEREKDGDAVLGADFRCDEERKECAEAGGGGEEDTGGGQNAELMQKQGTAAKLGDGADEQDEAARGANGTERNAGAFVGVQPGLRCVIDGGDASSPHGAYLYGCRTLPAGW